MKPILPVRASVAALIALASWAPVLTRTAGAAIPGYVIAPITLVDRSNQAAVRATLNGRSTLLIVDTGASSTALDGAFYKKAQVRSSDAAPGQLPPGVGRKFTSNGEPGVVGYLDSLQVGGAELGKRRVAVLDISSLYGRYNNRHGGTTSVNGFLGEDVLRHYSAIIDWARRGVYFNIDPAKRLKLGPGLVASGWTAVPMFGTNDNHFTVACTVEGQPARLVVDTGATFTSFAPDIVPLKHMLYNRDSRSIGHIHSNAMRSTMIGQSGTAYPAKIEHWRVGTYEIASSVVAVHQMPPFVLSEQSGGEGPMLGLLGAEILAANNAIIDIAGSTLYLKPYKH